MLCEILFKIGPLQQDGCAKLQMKGPYMEPEVS